VKHVRRAAIVFACLVLGACSSPKVKRPLHSSFEDLSSEVDTKSGIALEFDSALNIGGLSRLIAAGDRLYYPGSNLSDHYSISFSSDEYSYADVAEFKTKSGYQAVKALYDKYVGAREALIASADAELSLTIARIARASAQAKAQGHADLVLGQLHVTRQADQSDAQYLEAIDRAVDKLAIAAKTASSRAADAKLDYEKQIAVESNVLATRWTTRSERDGSAGIGDIAGVSGARSDATTGVMFAGDIRVETLRFGYDYVGSQLTDVRIKNFDFLLDLSITTFVVAARHMIYAQDQDYSRRLGASLKLTPDVTAALRKDFANALLEKQIAVSASLAELASLGNNGNFSSPERRAERIDFSRGCNAAYGGRSAGEIKELPLNGYLPFYSVRARGRALIGSVFEAVTGTKLEQAMKEGTVSTLARLHFKGDAAACHQPVSRTASH
jgi:hypothetical protein